MMKEEIMRHCLTAVYNGKTLKSILH